MAATTKTGHRECGYCGRSCVVETMVYSAWTKTHYCGVEQAACERKGRRLARQRKVAA